MSESIDPSPPKTHLERVLGIFTDVKSGEAGTALLLTLNIFVLLTAYYVIKPVREGLILELSSGAEYKSYMSGVIAILLLILVPIYSKYAARMERNTLVIGVTFLFVSNLVLFYLGSSIELVRENLGLVFYLWVGIFNMMLVAQFWAFANDVYTEEQGKRLFPLVGLGASMGAALGSKITELLAEPLGRYPLLLVSAGLLSLCALFFHLAHKREFKAHHEAPAEVGESKRKLPPGAEKTEPAPQPKGAFALVFSNRYLRLLALFSLVFTLVNTNGEYLLGKMFKLAADTAIADGSIQPSELGDFITKRYAGFFFYVNVIGIFLQALVVSRLVKYGGLSVAFMVLPLVALVGGVAFLLFPILAIIRIGKIAENSVDYSVNNTVRNMLWLPTTREMKYRAKQAVDTFFVRLGDVVSAIVVAIGAGMLGLEISSFVLVNVVLVAFWLVLARAIVVENQRMYAENEAKAGA